MLVNQPVTITLPASTWLELGGWMMAKDNGEMKSAAVSALLSQVADAVLGEP